MNNNSIRYSLIVVLLVALAFSFSGGKESDFDFYTIEEIGPKQLELIVEASGAIEAISAVEIKSKASGEILYLGAEVGDLIQKSEVLARIDQRTPSNTLSQTQADLDVAKVRLGNADSQLKRGIELHKAKSISDKAFEDIQEQHATAKAQLVRAEVFLENAKIALDDTLVRSPIKGTVIFRPVEIGQVITSPTAAVGGGTLLMTMANLNQVRVRAVVDEIDIGKISLDQEVTLRVSAFRDKKFTGIVSKVEPLGLDVQNVTTFPVLIDIENKENLLLLGMNTEVEIEILNEKASLAVPSGSLRTRKDISFVAALVGVSKEDIRDFLSTRQEDEGFTKFVVIKDTNKGPVLTWVKVGSTDFQNVEVQDGLSAGDKVYVLPSEGLIRSQEEFGESLRERARR
ncbi:MAG TPA: efflux RND transporter periplasmic adaptor subunit [Gammaproteobacteria bacterium]|jgi:HlyD family secretion protein|nr:efflux RND transporter periplasmic adaptor subunit [Gammaproteobacteria bacterium]HIO04372.1 efflux RND transporter periplasmic adaptor subunit [Gammaproteobacteria bacterium]